MKKIIILTALLIPWAAAVKAQGNAAEARGDSCIETHDTYNALRYYGEAAATDSSARLQRKIARCHYMRGDYRRCVDTMLPVAGEGGDSLNLEQMRYVFESYKRLGDRVKQMAWGLAILRRCPMDGEVTADVAALYNSDKMYSPGNARSLTETYLKKDSTCIPVLRQNADAYFLQQNFDEAIRVYNKLMALGDSSYNVVYSLGMSYMQTKDLPAARRWLLKAAEKKQMKDVGCLYRLGMVCVDMDSVAEGINYLDMAYDLMQPDGHVVYIVKRTLGEGYYKKGDYWNAIYAWIEALKRNRNSMATIFNIAQAYGLVGQPSREKAFYRSFLSMAALVKSNPELDKMVKQAEAVVGTKEDFKGTVVMPPIY